MDKVKIDQNNEVANVNKMLLLLFDYFQKKKCEVLKKEKLLFISNFAFYVAGGSTLSAQSKWEG